MPQISKGDTFTDGEQLTAARLNQLIDSAIVTDNIVSDQPVVYNAEQTDYLIILKSGGLSKISVQDLSNSGLDICTSTISGVDPTGAGADITIDPPAGKKVDILGPVSAESSSIAGNTTIGGTLNVTGGTTLAGGISGNTTINGNLTIGAGKTLTLDSAPTTNLHAATKAYVDGTSLKSNNGWVKLPNGLIFQWGQGATAGSRDTSYPAITFPIAFPNACLSVNVSTKGDGTAYSDVNFILTSFTNTTLTLFAQWYGSGYDNLNYPIWFAIGH